MQETTVHTILTHTMHFAIGYAAGIIAFVPLSVAIAPLGLVAQIIFCLMAMCTTYCGVLITDGPVERIACKLNTAINWLRSKAPVAK